ncbi:GDSL-type esterase/lipase family protein [Cohnella faecalis]|nr:GDSL-type esterase/lipase family protein [Cohnella faecalis]
MTERIAMIKPGKFGSAAAADGRRDEFDYGNEVILTHGVSVDFVFIGDSITHMWELNAYFARGGKFVVNRGIGGDITSHALRRFDADVVQLKPKHVVIKIGINNFWELEAWIAADRKPADAIADGAAADIGAMIRKAKDAGITPVVCSVLPTNMPFTGHDAERNRGVNRLNAVLRKIAGVEGAIYVDYHSRMLSEDGTKLRDGLADDGIHPHVAGYDIMADALREELSKHGISF